MSLGRLVHTPQMDLGLLYFVSARRLRHIQGDCKCSGCCGLTVCRFGCFVARAGWKQRYQRILFLNYTVFIPISMLSTNWEGLTSLSTIPFIFTLYRLYMLCVKGCLLLILIVGRMQVLDSLVIC